MDKSRDLDYSRCEFCDSSVPVWELDEGVCETCRSMDYVERQALIADEQVLRNEFSSAYKQ